MRMVFVMVILVALAEGCLPSAKPRPLFDPLTVGMTESEVVSQIGKPDSVAQQGNTKYYEYESWDIDPSWGNKYNNQYHFIRFKDGKVESFGRKGDFDSVKNPTSDINIKQKIEIENTKSSGDSSGAGKADLEAELKKYERLKKDGLLNDAEYQILRQRAIDKAKVQ